MFTTILILIAVGGILLWTFVQDRAESAADEKHPVEDASLTRDTL